MVEKAGLTPAQTIKAATSDAAACLRAKGIGALEPGAWADFIVLEKNPLENIRNTRSIESVWIAGRRIALGDHGGCIRTPVARTDRQGLQGSRSTVQAVRAVASIDGRVHHIRATTAFGERYGVCRDLTLAMSRAPLPQVARLCGRASAPFAC